MWGLIAQPPGAAISLVAIEDIAYPDPEEHHGERYP
jgi:hypothetical protein